MNDDLTREQVAALKPGEKVGIRAYAGWYGSRVSIATVERRTATQVTVTGGRKFNKYGREVGEGSRYHSAPALINLDAALRMKAEQDADDRLARSRKYLNAYKYADLSQSECDKLLAVLAEISAARKGSTTLGDTDDKRSAPVTEHEEAQTK